MKKILLTALSLMAMTCAYAGITGVYTVTKYSGNTMDDTFKFVDSERWTSEDPDAAMWDIEVTEAADGYVIKNLMAYDEELSATYDESTGCLVIAAEAVSDADYDEHICGGSVEFPTGPDFEAYINDNGGWISKTQEIKDIQIKIDGNTMTLLTPICCYYPEEEYDYLYGYCTTVYESLEAEIGGTMETVSIAGDYTVYDYAGVSVGSDWKMSDEWSINDVEEGYTIEDYYYTVTISEAEDGGYTIENLLGWGETVSATLVDDVIYIEAGTLVDEENEAYIMGGTEKYPSFDQIVAYLNNNNTYMYSSQVAEPVTLKVEDGNINLVSPIVVYYPYEGYIGYAGDVYSTLKMRPAGDDAVKAVELDSNAPVEYYNLQGVRIANPANGQIVIKRQGSKVSKVVVR